MATEDLFIIAIEMGSSKVTGIGGKRLPDGSVEVCAVIKTEAADFMRNGMIFNMRKSVDRIKFIITQLQNQLKCNVTQVYIGHGGQGLHSVENVVIKNFETMVPISTEVIKELMTENSNTIFENQEILEVVPLEYGVGTQKQIDPVGVLSDHVDGHFLNIIARPLLRNSIQECMKQVGKTVVEYKCTPLAVADEVLSNDDKRSGCMLVDFGADTTTVSVYWKNLLRYVGVIPLGSNNITKDIMSLQIDWDDAEKLKKDLGYIETEEMTDDERAMTAYTLIDGTKITKGQIAEVIEARLEEILINVKDQVNTSGFAVNSLMCGAIVLGGGSTIRNLSRLFKKIVGDCKVNIVKLTQTNVRYAKSVKVSIETSSLLGALSLLAKGTQICTNPLVENAQPEELFAEQKPEEIATDVKTEEQKEETSKEESEKPIKPKGPSIWKRIIKGAKDISDKLAGEE